MLCGRFPIRGTTGGSCRPIPSLCHREGTHAQAPLRLYGQIPLWRDQSPGPQKSPLPQLQPRSRTTCRGWSRKTFCLPQCPGCRPFPRCFSFIVHSEPPPHVQGHVVAGTRRFEVPNERHPCRLRYMPEINLRPLSKLYRQLKTHSWHRSKVLSRQFLTISKTLRNGAPLVNNICEE